MPAHPPPIVIDVQQTFIHRPYRGESARPTLRDRRLALNAGCHSEPCCVSSRRAYSGAEIRTTLNGHGMDALLAAQRDKLPGHTRVKPVA